MHGDSALLPHGPAKEFWYPVEA
ncbi:hypothetical protein XHV734_1363 [Xanthomonas hortorum pv. vitians]|nr:hypothetical protein XHV734_1363 [Xanthomonas hortorum pv. vitians]